MDPKFCSVAIAMIYAWGAFIFSGVGAALAWDAKGNKFLFACFAAAGYN